MRKGRRGDPAAFFICGAPWDDDAVKRIYSAPNLPEAYLVRDLLVRAGIPAHVFNQHAMGAMGEVAFGAAYPQVWIVQTHQEPHARAVLADYETRPASAVVKACPACGEENPAEFDLCWNCAATLALEA